MCADMCIGMCIAMCVGMCIDMCVDMPAEPCVERERASLGVALPLHNNVPHIPAFRHVFRHVCRHAAKACALHDDMPHGLAYGHTHSRVLGRALSDLCSLRNDAPVGTTSCRGAALQRPPRLCGGVLLPQPLCWARTPHHRPTHSHASVSMTSARRAAACAL